MRPLTLLLRALLIAVLAAVVLAAGFLTVQLVATDHARASAERAPITLAWGPSTASLGQSYQDTLAPVIVLRDVAGHTLTAPASGVPVTGAQNVSLAVQAPAGGSVWCSIRSGAAVVSVASASDGAIALCAWTS